MKVRNLLIVVAAASSLLASAAHANAITATFDYGWTSNPLENGTVTFTGNEENNGAVKLADLTSLTLVDNMFGTFHLSDVNAFGTFNATTNTWSNNASDWFGRPTAWITANNKMWSLNSDNNGFVTPGTTSNQAPAQDPAQDPIAVPEPVSLTLLGAGLLSLGATRRRKQPQRSPSLFGQAFHGDKGSPAW